MAQLNESISEDSDNRCRRKWDSINNSDLYFDEELDYEYEYSDEDIDKSFSLTYTWSASSVASSPSSSRPASPINLLDDDEEEYAKTRAIKKLKRKFNNLVAVKHTSSPPYLRQNWRKNASFTGILKQWRIRSLDLIFSFKIFSERSENIHLASTKQRVTRPMYHQYLRNTAVDPISNLSIVVNNNLCTTAKPNFQSSSQMADLSELFLDKSIFDPCDEPPVCDTIVRTALQQPSQERDYRPTRPVSAISFKQTLKHESYKRPASAGVQRIVRPRIFSNFEEENGGEKFYSNLDYSG